MNKKIQIITLIFLLISFFGKSQNLQVETLVDLNASGGVTFGPDGNIYVSDYGAMLSGPNSNTKVYTIEYGTWNVNEFATGFSGASGSRFDSQGNFYQSNPSGGRVSKVTPDGNVNLNWATTGFSAPIGITNDSEDNLYVCNCGNNTIRKVTPAGVSTQFASGTLFNCPNGITIDPDGNLYACNFSDGRIIKITPSGLTSLFQTLPTTSGVGNGHLTYSNGFIFVATIGTGQIYKLDLDGISELIAGVSQGFSNNDGPALEATFSKPNGLAASITGDTLFVNCSVPTWISSSNSLHPGKVRMITGVCSLPDVDCDFNTKTEEVIRPFENEYATLFSPIPNPAKSEIELKYQIYSNAQNIQLEIIDASQKAILSLDEGRKGEGKYSIQLDINQWSPGIYFSILKSEEFILTQKIVVAK